MPSRESEGRRNEEPTAGEQRGVCHRKQPPRAGSLATKSILIFGKALPFAGRCRNEDLGWFKRAKGLQPFERLRTDDHGVLEVLSRRGAFIHLAVRRRTSEERGGPSLGASRLTRHLVVVSTSRRRKRGLGRCVARKRRIEERWPSALGLSACLQRCGARSVEFRVTHCPLPSKEGGNCEPRVFRKKAWGEQGANVAKNAQERAGASYAVRIGRSLDVLARR